MLESSGKGLHVWLFLERAIPSRRAFLFARAALLEDPVLAELLGDDLDLFRIIFRGEFNISGFKNKNIRAHMPGRTPNQISRLLKRLRKHGLIKKIGNVYKYYLTKLGMRLCVTALKLREMYIIPSLRGILET